MTQYQRAAWFFTVLVTLVAFGLLIPQLPARGDDSLALEVDTEVGMATASVVIPAGWDLDIAASSQRTPVASRDGVEVTIADAVWLGDSSGLLDNVSQLLFDGDAIVPEVAMENADADAEEADAEESEPAREAWQLRPMADAAQGAPVWVDVIRDGEGVVLVVVRGDVTAATALSGQIDAMAESVQLDLSTIDVDVRA